MCGIIGISGIENSINEIYCGLVALQHRGQDACGITTFSGEFNTKKGTGLVSEVFDRKHFERLQGNAGIGHVRYATVGNGSLTEIQPFDKSEFFNAAMAHNGNLTNFAEVKKEYKSIASRCDLEALVQVFHTHVVSEHIRGALISAIDGRGEALSEVIGAHVLQSVNFESDSAIDLVFDAIKKVMTTCEGSYSAITLIPGLGLMGFRDPYGIKPLIVGKKNTQKGIAYAFASEDVAFQQPLNYDFIKEIEPGSAFLVKEDGSTIEKMLVPGKQYSPCIFELIYFASQSSMMSGVSISQYRYTLGKELGMRWNEQGLPKGKEVVCSHVPSASRPGARGFSRVTGIIEVDVFARNNYMKRGFILPDKNAREFNAMLKLPIDFSALEDVSTLVLIDDSIVRGDTSKNLIERIRHETQRHGLPLNEIYFLSLAPPNTHPCVYGIDMSVDTELIAAKEGVEGTRKYIGVDHIMYQELPALKRIFEKLSGRKIHPCDACFSGNYPTGITQIDLDRMKKERLADKGSDYK